MSYEIAQRVVGLSLAGAVGIAGIDGTMRSCEPQGGDKANQPATEFDEKAGKHNLDLSMGGTALRCTDVEFVRDGSVIRVDVTISPPNIQGVTTRYRIESTEPTVEGEFSGTSGTISADGVGRHTRAYAEIAFPFGDDAKRTHTDDCNGQSVPIENAN